MKILVTGATGFVGGAIIEELAACGARNWKIYALAGRGNHCRAKIHEFFKVDITNPGAFSALENLSDLDAVVHSAGLAHQFQNSCQEKFFKVNVEGTRNVLEFAVKKSVRHFILISSVSVYGFESQTAGDLKKVDEQDSCFPKSAYAVSKFKAEAAAVEICRENNIALTILRLATVVGEEDPGNTMRLIKMIDRRRFMMIGRGENYKTLIYKGDVARACRVMLEKKDLTKRETEVFNVAAEPIQMKSLVKSIANVLGKKRVGFFVPLILVKLPLKIISSLISSLSGFESPSETLKKWTSNEVFANEKIKQKYSFEPNTSIGEAVKRETNFYLENQKC